MATVIFDADDTLWDGVILESMPTALYSGVAAVLKELRKRGHRLVVCSRNDPARLNDVLAHFGIRDAFDRVYASWGAKSAPITEEAGQTGGPVLFVDDDAFNRAEIQAVVPGVLTLEAPTQDYLSMLDHPLLGPVARATTAEDVQRARLLREHEARLRATAGLTTDSDAYRAFLDASALHLTIYAAASAFPDPVRALDLLNRTTELRTVAKRYGALPHGWLVGAGLTDRYGDYGFIGVAVVAWDRGAVLLQDIAVSCRTMGRGVATALVSWIAQRARAQGAQQMRGLIRPSDRNGPMRELYRLLGFTVVRAAALAARRFDQIEARAVGPVQDQTVETWVRDLRDDAPALAPWLTVTVKE